MANKKTMEEMLDTYYKNEVVVHTYKIHDSIGNKGFWKKWNKRMAEATEDGFYFNNEEWN